MICKSCKKKVDDNSIYCRYCGERLVAPEEDKQHYSTIKLAFMASMVALICCFLPISKLGIAVYVLTFISSIVSMLFFLTAYKKSQKLYRKNEKYKGERLLKSSLIISIICLLSTVFTLTSYR